MLAIVLSRGWATAAHYLNDGVNYTEPMFVVVIMALASTRPIVELAESAVRRVAGIGGGTPAAWWMTILTIGPLLGSFITEPGAMTISALLLARQFYDLQPKAALKYATLGLLFVNVSIGGTLTHFAAPPILMVARPWGWDTAAVLSRLGWRAVIAIVSSTLIYRLVFRAEFRALAAGGPCPTRSRHRPRRRCLMSHCRFPGGSPSSTSCSSYERWSTHTTRHCLWSAFCFSWGLTAPQPHASIRCWWDSFWRTVQADCKVVDRRRCRH